MTSSNELGFCLHERSQKSYCCLWLEKLEIWVEWRLVLRDAVVGDENDSDVGIVVAIFEDEVIVVFEDVVVIVDDVKES